MGNSYKVVSINICQNPESFEEFLVQFTQELNKQNTDGYMIPNIPYTALYDAFMCNHDLLADKKKSIPVVVFPVEKCICKKK